MNKNTVLAIIAVIGVLVVGGLIYANTNPNFSLGSLGFGMSDQQIAQKAIAYINNNQLSQTPASLSGNATEESGLVKFTIKIGTNTFPSYATKDGKLLFPQVFVMTAAKTAAAATPSSSAQPATTKPANVAKVSSPMLEAFVVSSCPFGLQMQRAIVAAVKAVPQLAQYVKIRYIGEVSGTTISSMHGPEEGAENLRQICIREEQPAVYYSYLSCYMQKTTATAASGMPLGDSTTCQATAGVDTAKLNACVTDPSRGLAYAKADFALDTKYNVTGSPTSVLDGATVSEFDFGGRSPDAIRSMVCAAFKNQPSFCSQKLDTTQAATSFSATYADATTGSSASNTNCNTAAQ